MNHNSPIDPTDAPRGSAPETAALEWKLKSLPEGEAPADLIPRVLAELRAEEALTRILSRESRQGEEGAAPPSLIPKVLAAIEARSKPFWSRAWATWPRPLQVASTFSFLICAWLTVGLLVQVLPLEAMPVMLDRGLEWVNSQALQLQNWIEPARRLGHLISSIPTYYFAAAILVYLLLFAACVGLATACLRLALPEFGQRRSRFLSGTVLDHIEPPPFLDHEKSN